MQATGLRPRGAEGEEDALRRMTQLHGVRCYAILDRTGIPIKFHGMDNKRAMQLAGLVSELAVSTRIFLAKGQFDGGDADARELQTVRLRTVKDEIIISPDENYTLVVIHQPDYVEEDVAKSGESGDEDESRIDSRRASKNFDTPTLH